MTDSEKFRYEQMIEVAAYRNRLRKHPRLVYLFFELTDKCNMKCLHCGSSCKGSNHTYLEKEQIYKVLEEVAEKYGTNSVMICLTGGEPMLHPDFYEIIMHIHNTGFGWGMTSNGTLINEETALMLSEAHMGSISISLDGLAPEHNFLRNRLDAFQLAENGIKSLLSCEKYRGGITQVTTVVHKKNIDTLDTIYEYLKRIGLLEWRLTNIDPIGRTLENKDLSLDNDDFVKLLTYIRDKRFDTNNDMNVTYGCAHYLTAEWERMTRDNYFICGAGINVAGILCNCDIYSCFDIERRPELVQGNIKMDNFVDVWENRFQIYRKDRTLECSMCKECEDKFVCGADSYHTWDFEKQEPKICFKNKHFT